MAKQRVLVRDLRHIQINVSSAVGPVFVRPLQELSLAQTLPSFIGNWDVRSRPTLEFSRERCQSGPRQNRLPLVEGSQEQRRSSQKQRDDREARISRDHAYSCRTAVSLGPSHSICTNR